jgi:hypothetical protein
MVGRSPRPSLDFVAAGKTNRDYAGLEAAASAYGLSGVIFRSDATVEYAHGVRQLVPGRTSYLTFLSRLADARYSVIPLSDPDRLSGLTEAADAIALGVPIISSYSAKFPYFSGEYCAFINTNHPAELAAAIARDSSECGRDRLIAGFNMLCFASLLRGVLLESAEAKEGIVATQ